MAKASKKKQKLNPLDSVGVGDMNVAQYDADFKTFMDFTEVQRAVMSGLDFCEKLLKAQAESTINMTAVDKKKLDKVYAQLKGMIDAK